MPGVYLYCANLGWVAPLSSFSAFVLQGYREFSLLSLSCSDYLALPAVGIEIKNRLKNENVSLSLPSQRVDRFDENIAHIITNSGKKSGLTFAPGKSNSWRWFSQSWHWWHEGKLPLRGKFKGLTVGV